MVLVCGYALIAGRWPERIAALGQAANWLGATALQIHNGGHQNQPMMFLADCAFFALLGGLNAATGKRWTRYAFAFQLLIVLTHIVYLFDSRLSQWAFFTAYLLLSWCVLIVLGAGAFFEARLGTWSARLRSSFFATRIGSGFAPAVTQEAISKSE